MASILGNSITDDSIVFQVDFSNRRSFAPNLLNYSVWATGSTSIAASSSVWGASQYTNNGLDSENTRIIDTDPFGFTQSVVWQASSLDNYGTGDTDGGWNGGLFPIDPTKLYRFSVWTKRSAFGAGTTYSGQFYHGFYGYNSGLASEFMRAMNTGATGQGGGPYFHAIPNSNTSSQSNINPPYLGGLNTWTLVVGHVWPYTTATGSAFGATFGHPDSGVYTRASGKVGWLYQAALSNAPNYCDFIWNSTTAYAAHRSYFFYSGDPTSVQKFAYPRVDVVDGTEPTIAELLAGTEPVTDVSPSGNVIYPINYTNYSTQSVPTGAMAFDRRASNGTPIIGGTLSGTFSLYSMGIWFKPSTDIDKSSASRILVGMENPWVTGDGGMLLSLGTSSVYLTDEVITLAIGTTVPFYRTAVLEGALPIIYSSSWHNITINWESTSYAIYFDGVKLSTSFGTSNGDVPLKTSMNYISIGGRVYTTQPLPYNTNCFDGEIGAVTCWSRSLTSTEIASNYNFQKRKYGIG